MICIYVCVCSNVIYIYIYDLYIYIYTYEFYIWQYVLYMLYIYIMHMHIIHMYIVHVYIIHMYIIQIYTWKNVHHLCGGRNIILSMNDNICWNHLSTEISWQKNGKINEINLSMRILHRHNTGDRSNTVDLNDLYGHLHKNR